MSFDKVSEGVEGTVDCDAALTPPTYDNWEKTVDIPEAAPPEVEPSEVDGIEDIEPDHYCEYGGIPVFKPTMDQFRSFKDFVRRIDKYGMKSGIVKVVPPKEWSESLLALDEAVKSIKVKNPITQEFSGTHGTYTQANIEKQRSYNLPQWKALTEESQHQPPARRGERRLHKAKVAKSPARQSKQRPSQPSRGVSGKKAPGRPRKKKAAEISDSNQADLDQIEGIAHVQAPPTPKSPNETLDDREEEEGEEEEEDFKKTIDRIGDTPPSKDERATMKGSSQTSKPKSISARRKFNRQETNEHFDEAAFKDFDYRFHGQCEYTPERCKELEALYWKSLTFAPPLYGADMPGSLFDASTTSWNVAKLENLLDVLGQKIPGVNTAYLYLGMWKATFAWHLEDVDLYSINYIHFGAPKQWYSISQEDARRFENAMKSIWPTDAKNCSQFLRHKTYLISPALLQSQFNIRVNRMIHNEGEFVITFPYGYHSGYNLGYNCAESVNFATEAWLEYGRIAKKCNCEADSVWVNVEEIERKLRGELTPEYDEVTDEDCLNESETFLNGGQALPSPPASVLGKTKQRSRKRKLDIHHPDLAQTSKKIKLRINAAKVESCLLCPNGSSAETLLPCDTGRSVHRICALYTPETYLSGDENGNETVLNVKNIDKARIDLKCNFCRSKKGACFQCSAKKCTRAFHATCAAAAGVQVDYGPTSFYGDDGTEYIGEAYDFRCRFHRVKRPKNISCDTLENIPLINSGAQGLSPGDTAQFQFLSGDVFAGIVVDNRAAERCLLIDVLPYGDRVEVDWKWLLKLDPNDSQLPRPSASARTLPPHLIQCAAQTRNPQFGPPRPGDHFCDSSTNLTWGEFKVNPEVCQSFSTRSDLSRPGGLWFYLWEHSTETKAVFTESVRCRGTELGASVVSHHQLQEFEHMCEENNLIQSQPPRFGVQVITTKEDNDARSDRLTSDSNVQRRSPTYVRLHAYGTEQSSPIKSPQESMELSITKSEQPKTAVSKDPPLLSSKPTLLGFVSSVDPDYKQDRLEGWNIVKEQFPLTRGSVNCDIEEELVRRSPINHKLAAFPGTLPKTEIRDSAKQVIGTVPAQDKSGDSCYGKDQPDRSELLPIMTPLKSEYIKHIARYPYLVNSFLRRPKGYVSPYSEVQ